MQQEDFEVIIIGGSYAGLSAALTLGRSMRQVLVIDGGNSCNRRSHHAHNFITHDGEKPAIIALKAKEQVMQYKSVHFLSDLAVDAVYSDPLFEIQTDSGLRFRSKKLLFATGLNDIMPDIPGFANAWGISIFHCPYCHGYEFRGKKTGILGNGDSAFKSAKMIRHWAGELTLFTNGKSTLSREQSDLLARHRIAIIEHEITHIESQDGMIRHLVLDSKDSFALEALYARPLFAQQCRLPESLGCAMTDAGLIEVDMFQKTSVRGLYAAGDNSSWGRAVSTATAHGSLAGMMLNKELIDEAF